MPRQRHRYSETSEGQRELRTFVEREVAYNVSMLVYELAKDDHYMDDLTDVLYGPEDEETGEPREIFEHYIVTGWLAERLAEKGEAVLMDFYGLTLWGRATTGQAVYMDGVIEEIYADMQARRQR